MSTVEASYGEATARQKVRSVPLSHLSIELGHLYRENSDLEGPGLARHFARVAPQVEAAKLLYAPASGKPVRMSTCYLIDDYFTEFQSPAIVIPALQEAAASAGLQIDYLAREAGCAFADGIDLASLVERRLVPEPSAGADGSRPPVTQTGWLSNGRRSPVGGEAMGRVPRWGPPEESSARRHSIFVDVELWSEKDGHRTWSSPFLAAVWQLLRLGMLRFHGSPVAQPQPVDLSLIREWDELPAVIQLTPEPAAFSAYQTFSVLSGRFLSVEHAVRVILEQVSVDDAVINEIAERSQREGFVLPPEIVRRINYFLDGSIAGDP
ncbi:SCO2522 family protein [Cryptosporangium sp. NPDC048952]|uniref:SCO2522 family protein n=1 Tax=Cryptosporangium sp. NPDC048952 TaxID=3363961 RepID=UPI00371D2FEE